MLTTFAFDVCHDVYRAAREAIETKIPTLNAEASGKYTWRPDRMPRLAEYVCDFERAGERALGGGECYLVGGRTGYREEIENKQVEARSTFSSGRASRMTLFRMYHLGGAEYGAARRHLGISEITWADWADEIRRAVGRELTRAGVFPPSKYFRETTAKAS
jgi:hypothetical protein